MHISTQCQTRSHPDRCCWTPLSSPPKKYFGSSLQPAKVPLILWPPDPIIPSLCVQLVRVLYRLCGESVEGDSSAEKLAAQRPICPGPVLQRTAAPSQNPLQTAVTFGWAHGVPIHPSGPVCQHFHNNTPFSSRHHPVAKHQSSPHYPLLMENCRTYMIRTRGE